MFFNNHWVMLHPNALEQKEAAWVRLIDIKSVSLETMASDDPQKLKPTEQWTVCVAVDGDRLFFGKPTFLEFANKQVKTILQNIEIASGRMRFNPFS